MPDSPIAVDLHVHSIRSSCGVHTLLEIVSIMHERGLAGFALTDHSPLHGTPRSHFSVMLRRMPQMVDGLRVFKGIEATIIDDSGEIEAPIFGGVEYEIVLAALHHHGVFGPGPYMARNTTAVTNALRRNPRIKVITHPFYDQFPVDMDALTDVACETDTALEVNNAYFITGKADHDAFARMMELCKEKGVKLTVDSDGHMFNEIGTFDSALAALEPYGIPPEQVMNRTMESTLAFLGLEG